MLKLLKMKLFAPDVVESLWAVWFPCGVSAYLFREQRHDLNVNISTEFLIVLGCHFFPFLKKKRLAKGMNRAVPVW